MTAVTQGLSVQKVWGVFNAQNGSLVGLSTSGETPYQSIVGSAQIVTNLAGVRLVSRTNNIAVIALGTNIPADGGGGTYAYNSGDNASGAWFIGQVSGTVLTVLSMNNGNVSIGLSINRGDTGASIGTVLSFGTGTGQTGTYNLNASSNIPGPFVFSADNNSSLLVGADGGRWYITSAITSSTLFLAPSGNPAIQLSTSLYQFGNATDNPSFSFLGNGFVNMSPGLNFTGVDTIPPADGMYLYTVNGLALSTSGIQRLTLNGSGNLTINAPTSGQTLGVLGAAGSFAETVFGNATVGSSRGLQILAGTSLADVAALVQNQAGTSIFFEINGDGSGTLGPSATSGLSWPASGAMTITAPGAAPALAVTGSGVTVGTSVPGGNPGAGSVNVGGGYLASGMPQSVVVVNTSPSSINTTETYVASPLSIPANALVVGNSFRLTAWGQCTTTAANTVTFQPRLGSSGTTADTSLGAFTCSSTTTGTNVGFKFEALITITAVNASTGSTLYSAVLNTHFGTGIANQPVIDSSGLAVSSQNTTQATKLGLSFKTAASTTSAQFFQVTIERLF